jgi:hypothetical protein
MPLFHLLFKTSINLMYGQVSFKWDDLVTLVKNNEVEVFTLKGEAARDEFLAASDELEDKESTGVSLQWAVVGGHDDLMKLQLQAMPALAPVLNDKPTLRADNVPFILLQELPIHCEMYDGENMAGPLPTLFGSGEETLLETIKENLTTVHADLQKMARRFFCPEFIHPKEAAAVMAAPREGSSVCRFRRPKFQRVHLSRKSPQEAEDDTPVR